MKIRNHLCAEVIYLCFAKNAVEMGMKSEFCRIMFAFKREWEREKEREQKRDRDLGNWKAICI